MPKESRTSLARLRWRFSCSSPRQRLGRVHTGCAALVDVGLPDPLTHRSHARAQLGATTLCEDNYRVYRARKLWKAAAGVVEVPAVPPREWPPAPARPARLARTA